MRDMGQSIGCPGPENPHVPHHSLPSSAQRGCLVPTVRPSGRRTTAGSANPLAFLLTDCSVPWACPRVVAEHNLDALVRRRAQRRVTGMLVAPDWVPSDVVIMMVNFMVPVITPPFKAPEKSTISPEG